ncbi:MAG TPA: hypothetical protein VE991_09185, partial [Acidimicrobiales bacterium]|nr:hypothetical protein [Acidimicrobiales bacterium]
MRWGRVAKFAVALSSVAGVILTAGVHGAGADAPHFPGGGVLALGDAKLHGDFSGMSVNSPLEALAPTADGNGYWVAAADGGVFAFGDAPFLGSMGNRGLYAPIVGMASPDTGGYWLVALDGGIFAFGDAPFLGSMGGTRLAQPIVGMAATPDG